MEKISKNPGLQHLAEKVFWNLVVEDLRICAQINQSCQQILKNPIFWLRKFKHLSMENKKDWIGSKLFNQRGILTKDLQSFLL